MEFLVKLNDKSELEKIKSDFGISFDVPIWYDNVNNVYYFFYKYVYMCWYFIAVIKYLISLVIFDKQICSLIKIYIYILSIDILYKTIQQLLKTIWSSTQLTQVKYINNKINFLQIVFQSFN